MSGEAESVVQSDAEIETFGTDLDNAPEAEAAASGAEGLGLDLQPDDDQEELPEGYADFALPDGVEVEATAIDGFKGIARELGLNQAAAQKLLSFEAERIRGLNEAAAAKHGEQVEAWGSAARADTEYGGDDFDRNAAVARNAVERFAPQPVKELLDQTGLGSHPEVIRMFWNIGRHIRPDGIVTGGDGGGVPDDPEARAQRFYALNKASKPAAK